MFDALNSPPPSHTYKPRNTDGSNTPSGRPENTSNYQCRHIATTDTGKRTQSFFSGLRNCISMFTRKRGLDLQHSSQPSPAQPIPAWITDLERQWYGNFMEKRTEVMHEVRNKSGLDFQDVGIPADPSAKVRQSLDALFDRAYEKDFSIAYAALRFTSFVPTELRISHALWKAHHCLTYRSDNHDLPTYRAYLNVMREKSAEIDEILEERTQLPAPDAVASTSQFNSVNAKDFLAA